MTEKGSRQLAIRVNLKLVMILISLEAYKDTVFTRIFHRKALKTDMANLVKRMRQASAIYEHILDKNDPYRSNIESNMKIADEYIHKFKWAMPKE